MHETSLYAGYAFSETYRGLNRIIVDVGGKDVNGSLRQFFNKDGNKYICVDLEAHNSVDIVINPGDKLPFDDNSVDLVVSTSCFEHDPVFWLTFKEMCRIVKLGGFIYVNAPSKGYYHGYPGDNWRFYGDAGYALSYWSSLQINNEKVFPAKVVETFHIKENDVVWEDFVCVWQRVSDKQTNITSKEKSIGILEKFINNKYNTI